MCSKHSHLTPLATDSLASYISSSSIIARVEMNMSNGVEMDIKIYYFTLDKWINPFPNKPWFLRVCSTSLLKTLWEKEKLVVTSNFSFSHGVFYTFEELFFHFVKSENCHLQTLSVWKRNCLLQTISPFLTVFSTAVYL